MDPERRAAFLAWLQPHDLRGANLRYSLLTLLHQEGRPCDIPTLRSRLERLGLVVRGPDPNKRIADVLRYECTKGRVVRVARGRYLGLIGRTARCGTTTTDCGTSSRRAAVERSDHRPRGDARSGGGRAALRNSPRRGPRSHLLHPRGIDLVATRRSSFRRDAAWGDRRLLPSCGARGPVLVQNGRFSRRRCEPGRR